MDNELSHDFTVHRDTDSDEDSDIDRLDHDIPLADLVTYPEGHAPRATNANASGSCTMYNEIRELSN